MDRVSVIWAWNGVVTVETDESIWMLDIVKAFAQRGPMRLSETGDEHPWTWRYVNDAGDIMIAQRLDGTLD